MGMFPIGGGPGGPVGGILALVQSNRMPDRICQ